MLHYDEILDKVGDIKARLEEILNDDRARRKAGVETVIPLPERIHMEDARMEMHDLYRLLLQNWPHEEK